MKKFKRSSYSLEERDKSTALEYGKAIIFSFLMFVINGFLVTLIASLCLFNLNDPQKVSEIAGKACLYIACIGSGLILSKRLRQKNVLASFVLSVVILTFIFLISLFVPGTANSVLWLIFIPIATIIGSLLGVKREKTKHRKRRHK